MVVAGLDERFGNMNGKHLLSLLVHYENPICYPEKLFIALFSFLFSLGCKLPFGCHVSWILKEIA